MKLEKREITLNEYDSLNDALCNQKLLLQELTFFLEKTERKQTRGLLLKLMKENAEDMFLLKDLMKNSSNE